MTHLAAKCPCKLDCHVSQTCQPAQTEQFSLVNGPYAFRPPRNSGFGSGRGCSAGLAKHLRYGMAA